MIESLTLAVDESTASFWQAVGIASLNVIGTLMLVGVGFLFRQLAALKSDLDKVLRSYVSQERVEQMIREAGVYRDDAKMISMRLDHQGSSIDDLKKQVAKMTNAYGHMGSRIESALKDVKNGHSDD